MMWVYAGDKPDRIVMEETYCHPEGSRKRTRGSIIRSVDSSIK